MKISNSAKYVIGVSAAVALLAGCSSGGGSSLAPGGNSITPNTAKSLMNNNHKVDLTRTLVIPSKSATRLVKRQILHTHAMKPNCCGYAKLLYVADAAGGSSFTGAVQVYDFPAGTYVGQLAPPPEGWFEPQGECVDKSGDVFIANTAMSTIDEYSHSGTFMQALADPGQYPVGCAYDRATGNLAVSNIFDISFVTGGSVAIYTGASGTPSLNYNPQMFEVYFLGYAGKSGTLYLDGRDASGFFQYASFSGGTFTPITVTGGSIGFPGGVQWSAKTQTMNVGDQDTFSAPTVYQVDPTGAITGSTVTQCTQVSDFCDIVQYFIKGSNLVGPDAVNLSANIFPYPAGGAAITTITAPGFNQPIGSAVSPDVPL